MLDDPNHFCLVIEEDNTIVSTCVLNIIKNLTRGARPYALIENVVTHQDYQNKGYATAILRKANEIAKEKNCYKVMLMTSSKEESTLRFYDKVGLVFG
ncbi:GNAT family N-acetyltransferase [Sporomusa sp. KB1]|uniref:GNAT family N-acetyltransferase n=1 Tax=Sporomusa sp. KB1 TaxID=943346 RepID=UPI001C971933|nr:GNAT family N-acetyltransferase [Sporomusa sp. KB1]